MKTCLKCGATKDDSEFYRYKNGTLWNSCKDCQRIRANEYTKNNKDKINIYQKRYISRRADKNLRRLYGVTLGRKMEMYEAQGGKCAICGKELESVIKAHLDHCHSTGKIRELLCYQCNLGIGYLKEDCNILISACEYITKHTQV